MAKIISWTLFKVHNEQWDKKYEGNATPVSISGNQSILLTHNLVNTGATDKYYQYSLKYDFDKFGFNGPPYNTNTSSNYISVSFPLFPKIYWNFDEVTQPITSHSIGVGISNNFISQRLHANANITNWDPLNEVHINSQIIEN